MEQYCLQGYDCKMELESGTEICLLRISGAHEIEESDRLKMLLSDAIMRPISIVTVIAGDWDRDLTPWPAPAVFGKREFGGRAEKTLAMIEQELIPMIKQRLGNRVRFVISGYSLGGLFSLWAMYESVLFTGCAACSPSVWFPGWREYIAERSPGIKDEENENSADRSEKLSNALSSESVIYLSLGNTEEKTKNAVMSKVGENIRYQYERLLSDVSVKACRLEWNEGGHFKESTERIVKGSAWVVNQI